MHVLAVGGGGAMGSYACRLVARMDGVRRLTVTDIGAGRAQRVADELGDVAEGIALDVTDPRALALAMTDVDIVMNTTGPFYRFGTTVLAAAIDAGCDYVDICDDWESTVEMLELHERARAANVSAILGLGASPGISNLLAVTAARELDETTEIVTGWNAEGATPEKSDSKAPNAAIVHGVQQMSGTIRVVRGGAEVHERPLQRTAIEYPGVGRRLAMTFGHPEPITLSRTLPQLTESVNVTFAATHVRVLMRALRWAAERRIPGPHRTAQLAERIESLFPAPGPARLFRAGALPPIFALARGTHANRPASVAAALAGYPGVTMGAITGTPLAVGVELRAAGGLSRRGVLAPEAAIDPDVFFAALARHCLGAPKASEAVLVTRSWDADATSAFARGVEVARRRLA